jgi:hypothetical protein
MPAKRRHSKRRIGENPKAWRMLFETGHDYLRDLPMPEDEAREAARDAWREFGQDFMARRTNAVRAIPWALEQFGDP